MQPRIRTKTADLFEARKRFWQAQGFRGAALFRQLAVDPELPSELLEEDIAAIEGIQPETMKVRRRKGMPPPYYRTFKGVRYDTAAYCDIRAKASVEAA